MQSQNRKRAPAWTEWEVLDLIAVWGGCHHYPTLSVDSDDGVLYAMPEDFADREDEEEEEDKLEESTQHTILPDSQDLFITLTEIPSQPNQAGEGTSAKDCVVREEECSVPSPYIWLLGSDALTITPASLGGRGGRENPYCCGGKWAAAVTPEGRGSPMSLSLGKKGAPYHHSHTDGNQEYVALPPLSMFALPFCKGWQRDVELYKNSDPVWSIKCYASLPPYPITVKTNK
ncbi:hypothetical protein UY3_19064 [Chelonia mydas]|uniref:Uncharacterized protein n=1 Tax=Chelonia mydas TaxID=8469 RepID=M7AMH1_CHEMY|nr:hypothetical protein UY3_19064 [Chelonia mydas]